jgi:hypothetical protein
MEPYQDPTVYQDVSQYSDGNTRVHRVPAAHYHLEANGCTDGNHGTPDGGFRLLHRHEMDLAMRGHSTLRLQRVCFGYADVVVVLRTTGLPIKVAVEECPTVAFTCYFNPAEYTFDQLEEWFKQLRSASYREDAETQTMHALYDAIGWMRANGVDLIAYYGPAGRFSFQRKTTVFPVGPDDQVRYTQARASSGGP